MKRFNFRLQRILDYRNHLEKEELNNFAKVLGEYVQIENTIEQAHNEKDRILLESETFIKRGDTSLFYYREMARKGLSVKMKNFNKKLQEKAVPLNQAREKLISARKSRKTLDILKDKAIVKYNEDLNKEEQFDLDEFGNTSHMRDGFLKNRNAQIE